MVLELELEEEETHAAAAAAATAADILKKSCVLASASWSEKSCEFPNQEY